MEFRKKPVVIEATQWFKNGDHPQDDPTRGGTTPNGDLWEGLQFRISKTNNGSSTQWAIIPTSGKFEDKVVAVADAVNMSNAKFVAKTCIGTIKSVWGLEILDPEIHHDRETLRGLSLGKAIDAYPTEVLTLDYDGYWDVAKRKCSRARRLLCFCDAIYAKGVE